MKSVLTKLRNLHDGHSSQTGTTKSLPQNPLDNIINIFNKLNEVKYAANTHHDRFMKSQSILDSNSLEYYEFDNINTINEKKTNHQELLYCEATPLATVSVSKIFKGKLKIWYHKSVIDHDCISETIPYEIIDVAVKVTEQSDAVDNENNEPEILHYLQKEPEFIKLYGYHIDVAKKRCIIVLEWCAGGDLFNYIEKNYLRINTLIRSREVMTIPISVVHIKQIIKWLVTAILKCQMRGICYSDLKLDNIMFANSGDISTLRLIDFGASRFISDHGKSIVYKFITTSIHYTPPEVVHKYHIPLNCEFLKNYELHGENLYKIDSWQIGVITYTLLNGRFPFDSRIESKKERYDDIFRQIGLCSQLVFTKNKDINGWALCDNTCRDFISKLIRYDPRRRITLQEALNHPWLG